jgi:hypothetical protein
VAARNGFRRTAPSRSGLRRTRRVARGGCIGSVSYDTDSAVCGCSGAAPGPGDRNRPWWPGSSTAAMSGAPTWGPRWAGWLGCLVLRARWRCRRAAHPADSPHGNLLVRLEESGVARRSKHRESSKKGGKSRLTRPISARMPLCQTAPLDPRPRRRQRTPPCIAQRHINRHEPRRRQGHRSLSLVPRRCGRLRSDGRGRELVSKEIGVHYMERFGEQLEELDIKSIPAKRKSS